MTSGELFLESLNSGVITQAEIDWLLRQQGRFSRADQGQIPLGCRMHRTGHGNARC